MEQQPPPLSPQEIANMQTTQYSHIGQPQTVKVFGIMHVIFAGFGFLSCAWVLVMAFAGDTLFSFGGTTSPEMQAQMDMQQEMMPMTIVSTLLTLIVATLMMIAGVRLLKKRRGGLKWSNRYAIASLVSKVIAVVLLLVYAMPAMKETFATSAGSMGPPAGTMETIMLVSMLTATVLPAIYPILALVLLNRPMTKAWFASQPE